MSEEKWLTPFLKQLYVVLGVSVNMANIGAIMGFTAILLPQLRGPSSEILVDDHSSSWIASIMGISLFVGNVMVPTLMGKFGRKVASLISCTMLLIGWVWIALATDVTSLLIARFLQGLAAGINLSAAPVMIGEMTSPSNRGFFSAIMTTAITTLTLLVHILGSYATWQTSAIVCAFTCCVSFGVLLFSPESPSWLADQERYDDSARAYRWLRGDTEESELEKMLETRKLRSVIANGGAYQSSSSNSWFNFVVRMLRKREFYMPVFIMIHLYAITVWTGMVFLIVFAADILRSVVGLTSDSDVAMHLTILDIQRLLSTFVGLFMIKRLKRRNILFFTLGMNVAVMIVLAGYTFAKAKFALPFDHPAIGAILMHIHMFSITTGALPVPIIISGELFPLEFRSLAGGISGVAFSLNFFVTSKSAIILINAIGIYGTYALYTVVTTYCCVVVWIFLPETKDRTLQDIEEEFKRKPKAKTAEELGVALPLNSEKNFDEEVHYS